MKILHLADLHFGKSIYGLSLLDSGDQAEWVKRFLELAEDVKPQAVVIAGDVYDRGAPSGAAVQLLSRMLTALSQMGIEVMVVAGNHDSAQRLSFANALLTRQGLHISSDLYDSRTLMRVPLSDEHGVVNFWLMPYVFPTLVAQALDMEGLRDYDTAIRELLSRQDVDFSERNVLIAHQNVTANGVESTRGGSESMIGGVGQVEYTAFDGFDYVALGHIHAAYAVGRDTVRYAGSPLCYHFDETRQREKGPLLVEIGEKGTPVKIETLTIPPLHPMREIRKSYEEILATESANTARGEYLRVVLTDRRIGAEERDALAALFKARDCKLLDFASDYIRETGPSTAPSSRVVKEKPVEQLFAEFYEARNQGEAPDEAAMALLGFAGEQLRHADTSAEPTREDVDRLLTALLRGEEEA